MIWKGSTLCTKIGNIIKRMMRCHTVEDVEKEFGNELKLEFHGFVPNN